MPDQGAQPDPGFSNPNAPGAPESVTPTMPADYVIPNFWGGLGSAIAGDVSDAAHSVYSYAGSPQNPMQIVPGALTHAAGDIGSAIMQAGPGTLQGFMTGQIQPGTPDAVGAVANTGMTYGTLASPFGLARAGEGEFFAGMPGRLPARAGEPMGLTRAEINNWQTTGQVPHGYIEVQNPDTGNLNLQADPGASRRPGDDQIHPTSDMDIIRRLYVRAFGHPISETDLVHMVDEAGSSGMIRWLNDHINETGGSPAHRTPEAVQATLDAGQQSRLQQGGGARLNARGGLYLGDESGLRGSGEGPLEDISGMTDPNQRYGQAGGSPLDQARDLYYRVNGDPMTEEHEAQFNRIDPASQRRFIGLLQAQLRRTEELRHAQNWDEANRQRVRDIQQMRSEDEAPPTTGLRLHPVERDDMFKTYYPDEHLFEIHNAQGEPVGNFSVTERTSKQEEKVGSVGNHKVYPAGTKHLYVEWVGSNVQKPRGAWAEASHPELPSNPEYGSFGPREIRQLHREVQRHFKNRPDPPKWIDGFRVGGVRGAKGGPGESVLKYKIPLSAGVPLKLPFDASDDELDQHINAHMEGAGP